MKISFAAVSAVLLGYAQATVYTYKVQTYKDDACVKPGDLVTLEYNTDHPNCAKCTSANTFRSYELLGKVGKDPLFNQVSAFAYQCNGEDYQNGTETFSQQFRNECFTTPNTFNGRNLGATYLRVENIEGP